MAVLLLAQGCGQGLGCSTVYSTICIVLSLSEVLYRFTKMWSAEAKCRKDVSVEMQVLQGNLDVVQGAFEDVW